MTIKLVSFDLDDTLWDNLPIIVEAESDMVNWLQERIPNFQEVYRATARRYRAQISQNRPQIQYDMNKIRMSVLERVLQDCTDTKEEAYELARSALCIFHGRRNRFLLMEDAEEVLSTLSEKYSIVSVTNGTSDIRQSSIGKYFEISLNAANVQAAKPNPIMFYTILSQADVRPQEAVHIGDHPVDDIECAAKIGMHTIQFHTLARGRQRDVSPLASCVVNCLADVPKAILEIENASSQ
ncbi:MAG: HAD-IA family hydrolase [Gammaproteobacteria bacterium]|nr:HAD-IA family hydrolase [Gammaproteobacteria bacterium]